MKKSSNQDACSQFRSVISELVSREAAADVVSRAEEHGSTCADCALELQLAERVEAGLGSLTALSELSDARIDQMLAGHGDLTRDVTYARTASVSCAEFRDALGDFVSEELPVGTMLDGVSHATTCPPCGTELSEMQTVQDALRSLAEVEPPATIWTSLMARIEAEEAAAPAAETAEATSPATARSKLLPVLG